MSRVLAVVLAYFPWLAMTFCVLLVGYALYQRDEKWAFLYALGCVLGASWAVLWPRWPFR
jgi:hypothetical protein